MHRKVLGKKQHEDNSKFQLVYDNIEEYCSKEHVDNLIDETLVKIKARVSGLNVGYGWSAGKDSTVLKFLMDELDINQCVMGMTDELEYPDILKWTTDNMPEGLYIFNSGHTIEWLSTHLDWLFPENANLAKRWFISIQHKAQIKFFREKNLDMILLGRRKMDSNYVGNSKKNKYHNIYTNQQGITRYSPISEWTHEETLAAIKYYDLPLSPFYGWVNGWVVGTGCWAARQWTGSVNNGWKEIYSIDPTIVRDASRHIDSAQKFLKSL